HRLAVERAEVDALRVPAVGDDWAIHEADDGVARVRNGDAFVDAGRAQLFTSFEGVEQRVGEPRFVRSDDQRDKLAQNAVPIRRLQVQVDPGGLHRAGDGDRL